jgi:hypothetical protein
VVPVAAGSARASSGQGLLHEGDALGEAASQCIGVTEFRGRHVENASRLDDPAQRDSALQRSDGLVDVAPAEGDESQAAMGEDQEAYAHLAGTGGIQLLRGMRRRGSLRQAGEKGPAGDFTAFSLTILSSRIHGAPGHI